MFSTLSPIFCLNRDLGISPHLGQVPTGLGTWRSLVLLVTRSHVLSTTTGEIIFDHSCVKLGEFTRTGHRNIEDACNKLLNLENEGTLQAKEPHEPSGAEKIVVGNWHLLKDVKDLANSLLRLSNEDKWKLIGSMWFEMLGYANTVHMSIMWAAKMKRLQLILVSFSTSFSLRNQFD